LVAKLDEGESERLVGKSEIDSAWLLASFFSNNLMTFSSISTGKTFFEYEGWSVGPKVG